MRSSRGYELLLACVFVGVHGAARADVTVAEFPATGQFIFNIDYMTDLDQKRAGLLNGGNKHCVPTAAMNLFSYAANFGFPEVNPGPGLWEGVEGHDTVTDAIAELGVLMSTDDGTQKPGYEAGTEAWIQASGVPLSYELIVRDGTIWPTVDLAAMYAATGAIVNITYGRYYWAPGPSGIPYLTDATSGHAVTLNRASANNGSYIGPREVRIRNPSAPDDEDLHSNSQFTTIHLDTAANMIVGYDLGGNYEESVVTSLINPVSTNGRLRIITSVLALYPPGGMSYTHAEVQTLFSNGPGFLGQTPTPIQVQLGSTIDALVVHPEQHSALALVSNAHGRKQLMQFTTGAARPVTLLDLPTTSQKLVVGAGKDVYVITASEIVRLAASTWSTRRVSQTALPSVVAGAPIAAAAFDPATGSVLIVSNGKVLVLDSLTFNVQSTLHIADQNARSLVILPGGARRFLLATADGTLLEGIYPAAGCRQGCTTSLERRRIDGVTDVTALDVDDTGRLYVSDQRAGLIELERDSTGNLRRATRAWHANAQTALRKFAVLRSHSNARPELLDGPEWRNFDPTELEPLGREVPDR